MRNSVFRTLDLEFQGRYLELLFFSKNVMKNIEFNKKCLTGLKLGEQKKFIIS